MYFLSFRKGGLSEALPVRLISSLFCRKTLASSNGLLSLKPFEPLPVSLTKTVRVINWWFGSRRWRLSTNILGVPCHKRIIGRSKASVWTSESELFLFLDARWRAYKSLTSTFQRSFQVSFYKNFLMFSSLLNFFENSFQFFLNLSNNLFEFAFSNLLIELVRNLLWNDIVISFHNCERNNLVRDFLGNSLPESLLEFLLEPPNDSKVLS